MRTSCSPSRTPPVPGVGESVTVSTITSSMPPRFRGMIEEGVVSRTRQRVRSSLRHVARQRVPRAGRRPRRRARDSTGRVPDRFAIGIPDAVGIFILPPSRASLRMRLEARGGQDMRTHHCRANAYRASRTSRTTRSSTTSWSTIRSNGRPRTWRASCALIASPAHARRSCRGALLADLLDEARELKRIAPRGVDPSRKRRSGECLDRPMRHG